MKKQVEKSEFERRLLETQNEEIKFSESQIKKEAAAAVKYYQRIIDEEEDTEIPLKFEEPK